MLLTWNKNLQIETLLMLLLLLTTSLLTSTKSHTFMVHKFREIFVHIGKNNLCEMQFTMKARMTIQVLFSKEVLVLRN